MKTTEDARTNPEEAIYAGVHLDSLDSIVKYAMHAYLIHVRMVVSVNHQV